ncbi:hypothetical protein [Micromonospora sp. AMSO31t]|uniref:hypothetical protein n=1 Tax=Micromonospora sp. AMSO31t TaxID=2650566 RepID=UPI00124BAA36|nr:hypothetical protein [Micromonospora sp. AMSO31t]KAB1916352.1 hypothetical protein F8274_00040 [Micromonospora sp. AMSO31t]
MHRRRGGRDRHRWPGAGHPETLTRRDRLLLTLAWLRLALPYSVDRSTVSNAIRQVRPLPAGRGFATPLGQRLHTLADVLAHAAAEGLTIRLDGTEIQVRPGASSRFPDTFDCWKASRGYPGCSHSVAEQQAPVAVHLVSKFAVGSGT